MKLAGSENMNLVLDTADRLSLRVKGSLKHENRRALLYIRKVQIYSRGTIYSKI